jgi:cytochrome P450
LDKYRREHTAEETEADSSIIGHLIKSPYPSDKERRADVTVFMIAGHETTANQVIYECIFIHVRIISHIVPSL